jgi:hypothetical protein
MPDGLSPEPPPPYAGQPAPPPHAGAPYGAPPQGDNPYFPPPRARQPWARPGRAAYLQALVVVGVFAVVGAALGGLWYWLWESPTGVVQQKQWYTDEHGLRDQFQGVALYVVLAVAAGLVLAVVFTWVLDRHELLTLLAVTVGALVCGLVIYLVGTTLGPADPQELARTAKDGARLPGALALGGWTPLAACPFAALLASAAVYFLTTRRSPEEVRTAPEPSSAPGFGAGTEG